MPHMQILLSFDPQKKQIFYFYGQWKKEAVLCDTRVLNRVGVIRSLAQITTELVKRHKKIEN